MTVFKCQTQFFIYTDRPVRHINIYILKVKLKFTFYHAMKRER